MVDFLKKILTLSAELAHRMELKSPAMLCHRYIHFPIVLAMLAPCAFAQDSTTQVPLDQFQRWMQVNGYAQSTAAPAQAPAEGSVPPPPFLAQAPVNSPDFFAMNGTTPPGAASQKSSSPPPLSYEQSQQVMQHSVPPTSTIPSQDDIVAFNTMLKQNMPMTPQQVVQLHQQIDMAQRAASIPANIPPKPVSSTIMINLAPGTTPPAVRLAQGYVSSLVFVDSTGAPWPIASFDIGNPKSVNIQWDGKSNILLLQAVATYSDGNMVVKLAGMPTPITLELVAGQRVVDYRVDIHVSGLGPNTKDLPIGTALPGSASQLLLGVLDGVGPAGSKLLNVQGADSQAWMLGEKIYLRTRFTVLSPGWMGKMVSPDGMMAYELPRTSSVLISRYGQPAELKIEGY